MSGKSRQPRPRSRDETMTGNVAARLECQRSLKQAFRNERAQAVVAEAIRRGDITPRPGSPEWHEIIQSGLDAGLLRKPNGKVKR